MNGWKSFAKYVGVQGVLALVLTAVVSYLIVVQTPVPSEIYGLLGVSWGFYFAKNGGNFVAAAKGNPH